MYEALVARVRYHIQKANFMGLKEAESTLLLNESADAIEELSRQLAYYHGFDGFLMAHGMFGPCEYVPIEPPKEE